VAITSPTANTAYFTNVALITLDGTATDDKGVVRVSWENNRGGGGVASGTTSWQISAIHLAAGVNVITVTAEDANGNLATDSLTVTANLPDETSPVVTITGPKPNDEFVVTTNLITLSGSVADNQAVTSLTWSNNRGGSDAVNLAGPNWTVTNLLLELGPNLIQVAATDSSGNIATDTAVIFFAPPDTNAPVIAIDFPTLNAVYETEFSTINLSGTAADNSQVVAIRWTSNHGEQGVAHGVSPWSANDISLQPGFNIIDVTASDAAGNTATDSLSVIYTPSQPPEVHDLAIVRLTAPRLISLRAAGPALTKRIKVMIQNRGAHDEVIPSFEVMSNLITVQLTNLVDNCAVPQVRLITRPPNYVPRILKSKQVMNIFFEVTFNPECVPDPLKRASHEDFSCIAWLNHAALDGNADTHPECDVCPRIAVAEPNPGGKIKDKGCGASIGHGGFGNPVLIDLFLKP
jgi:hypothetical protein